MKNVPIFVACAAALFALPGVAAGQSQLTEHIYRLDDPDARPAAKIDDVHWLVGNWLGEGFGNTFEEVWNPPSGGSMVGMFKLLDDGEVSFYEILLLVEEEGSLSLKVKHFNPDFSAWEDREDYVNFRLVAIEEDAIHFSGLSFYRLGPDRIDGYIAMKNADGVREEKLVYRRRPAE